MKLVLEASVEKRLKDRVRKAGGQAIKFVSPGMRGVPDRLVLMPNGRIAFVELKAPGKKPTPLQAKRHEQIQALGFMVVTIDSYEAVDEFLREWVQE